MESGSQAEAPTSLLGSGTSRRGGEVAKFLGHEGAVQSVAFTRDGKSLASGSGDKTIKIWDVGSGKEIGRAHV